MISININKIKIPLILIGVIIIIIIVLSMSTSPKNEAVFEEETFYCRRSSGGFLHKAELNSKDFNSVKVYIEENHNDISNFPDSFKETYDGYCDVLKYSYKENQIDFSYKCGDKKDIIQYNYVGSMKDAVKQLEDDGYECYTIEKNGKLQDIIKDKKWCNYRMYQFYYTFDEIAVKSYGSLDFEYSYSVNDNTITIHDDSYDITYTYDEEKNILVEDSSFNDYLFECDSLDNNYPLVKVEYYYDNRSYTIMPKSGFYNEDEYKFNHVECNNGVTATFDENRKMLFPSENIKSECVVYFDNVQN